MAKIRVIAKNTGIGNQIQFIPFIKIMQQNSEVVTDSDLYNQLGINIPIDTSSQADINYVLCQYPWKLILKTKLKYLGKGKLYGFKYKVNRKSVGWLLDKSLLLDMSVSEVTNNENLTGITIDKFSLPGWDPRPKTIAFGVSNKWGKDYKYWEELGLRLQSEGYTVKLFGDYGTNTFPKEKTPTIKDLYNELCKFEYYIGTDNGITHLADILGLSGIVLFGNTEIIKNKPFNNKIKVISKNLNCSPCYKIKKQCDQKILYDCLEIKPDVVVEEFYKVIKKS